MSIDEEWRPVVGWESAYEVSSHGNVRSLDRIVPSRGGTRLMRGRVLKLGHRNGYRAVHLSFLNHQTSRDVHRLVAEAFLGTPSKGMEVCHNDGDGSNNHVDNLRWGTHQQNIHDIIRHGNNHGLNKKLCSRGHALASPNLTASAVKSGRRMCLACNRAFGALPKGERTPEVMQEVSDRYFRRISQELV